MKGIRIAIYLFGALWTVASVSQTLRDDWQAVRTELGGRMNVIRELTAEAGKSEKVRRGDVEMINQRILQLEGFLKIPDFNAEFIENIRGVNTDLTDYVSKILVQIERDADMKTGEKLLVLLDRLTAADIRVKAAVDRYNAACKKAGRQALAF
jgi:hypothetical protein